MPMLLVVSHQVLIRKYPIAAFVRAFELDRQYCGLGCFGYTQKLAAALVGPDLEEARASEGTARRFFALE